MGDSEGHVQEIGFILIPGFALMCFASAVEPLRAANLLAGRELYRIHVFSPLGETVASSSGALVPAQPLSQPRRRLDALFVVAGGHPRSWNWPIVHIALRAYAREGILIGGISGGPYLLAEAGLIEDHRFTIHWEHEPALIEDFPSLKPEQARYVTDRNRMTCGGGVAPLDMMHALIQARLGSAFATRVSDWYLHTHVATSAEPQRASLPERHRAHHPALIAVLTKMEATIEQPLGRDTMARIAGVTPRHLDRLFAQQLGSTFLKEYRRIRLEHARKLLQQSALSVSEIAFACGFSSPAHFARRYRELYGSTPRAGRV